MKITPDLKCRIAREAATLLYFGSEKEYKLAKVKAARAFGTYFLPTNLEVALELDKMAEENEGAARRERLVRMRQEALKIMRLLKKSHPVLIGSVWRGTIRKGSDIDIAVYNDIPEEILHILRENSFAIFNSEWVTVTRRGKPQSSFHIHGWLTPEFQAEIVVRSVEETEQKRKCEIFGDELRGLDFKELQQLLEENPIRKFIPP